VIVLETSVAPLEGERRKEREWGVGRRGKKKGGGADLLQFRRRSQELVR